MRYIKVFALGLFFVLFMVFFNQNIETLSKEMTLRFFTLKSVPLAYYLLLMIFFFVGFVFALFFFFNEKIRSMNAQRKCRNRISELEQELNSLRNLPLEEEPYSREENISDRDETSEM